MCLQKKRKRFKFILVINLKRLIHYFFACCNKILRMLGCPKAKCDLKRLMSHNRFHFMDIFYSQNTMKISLCYAVVRALTHFIFYLVSKFTNLSIQNSSNMNKYHSYVQKEILHIWIFLSHNTNPISSRFC